MIKPINEKLIKSQLNFGENMKKTILFFSLFFLLASASKAQVIQRIYFDRFTHYNIDDWVTYAPATDITAVEIGDDYVYFGTRFGGILRYHLYDDYWDFPFTTSSGLRSNQILALSYDSNSRLLYAKTPKGVDVYNFAFQYWLPAQRDMPEPRQPDAEEIKYYQKEKNKARFPAYYRPSLKELPDLFTDRTYLFRPPDEILDPYNRIFHLKDIGVVDKFNRLWIATDGLGPAWINLNDNTLHLMRRSIANIYPQDLFFDGADIWVGGIRNGLEPAGICLWQNDPDVWFYYEEGLVTGIANDNVNAIDGTQRYIFFGTELGVVRYDKKKNDWTTFTRAQRLLSEKINDLLVVGNTLYIATDRGFNWLDIGYKNIQRSRDTKLNSIPVSRMAADDSLLYLATPYGIYQYDPNNDRVSVMKTGSAVFDVNVDVVGVYLDTLWFAGSGGVAFFDPKTKHWNSFTQIQMRFYDIAFTGGTVWFGTDQGLLKYEAARNYWYLYTTRDGLADNHVYRIDIDDVDLWLSTRGGVTVFRWYRPGKTE